MANKAKKRKGRREGYRVEIPYDLNAMFPYIMKRRCDAVIYFTEYINVEPLLEYIAKKKEQGVELGFFQMLIVALVKLLREREYLNRFVKGRRLYQREDVKISFIAKRQMADDGAETNINVKFKKEDDFGAIINKLKGEVKTAKSEEQKPDDAVFKIIMSMPRFLLLFFFKILDLLDFYKGIPKSLEDVDPLRASIYLANLGSVGINAPYHHLFEWGTCSIFVAVGRIQNRPFVEEDGSISSKKTVEIKVSLDDRIADGFYYARSLDLLHEYLNNPECLEELT